MLGGFEVVTLLLRLPRFFILSNIFFTLSSYSSFPRAKNAAAVPGVVVVDVAAVDDRCVFDRDPDVDGDAGRWA